MNRGKAAATESSGPTREFMKWTEDMDARLLHSMIEESRIGNRIDGSWTSQAYSNIVDHLHSSGNCQMASSSTKRPRKSRKGKESLNEAEDAAHVTPSVQDQLDQRRFFTNSHQMENYASDFYTRSIVGPKIMNFESFAGSGEVNKRRIRLKPADWLNVAKMKYDGQKLCFSNIPDDFPYDWEMALATMVLKNNIAINWPHHIMNHMLKCKASDTPLPYGVLITQIMQYCGVHVDADANTDIATRHHFSITSLKRLNIVNVNGVWQHDIDDDEEVEQPDHQDNLVQPPPPLSNPNMMTQMWEGVQDLQHRMQGMEQMQVRVECIEDNLANLSLDMNRQFAHLNQNVNLILQNLDH
ncbi:hypothetical protein LR48_Vigan02g104700 [Vigna angularis]|uniref:Uncharacterized protein n=1 Tax=Phaseolus angularis TaxID=3914 RepID=A0A0L9TWU5_PHAAN|nr:hypothetical protein LR48_Vigan02g104700 [Vigna angularis]